MVFPVSKSDEEFMFKPGENALKSKYVFPDGKYAARITDLEKGIAKSGKPKYVFKILGIEGPTEGIEYESHLSLSEAAQWKLLETLDAIGVKPGANGTYNAREAVGKPVTLFLKQQTNPDSGKKFMQIEALLPPGATVPGVGGVTPF